MGFRSKMKSAIRKISSIEEFLMDKAVELSLRLKTYKQYKEIKPSYSKQQINEIKNYWKQYTNKNRTYFQELYSAVNGNFDVRYIPVDLYVTKIDKYLNKKEYLALDNKCYYPILFDCPMPKILYMKINNLYYDSNYHLITEEEAISYVVRNGKAIFKPSTVSGGGVGITVWNDGDNVDLKSLLSEKYSNLSDYVVQDLLEQHDVLKSIHKESVNTLRIQTLLIHNKIVHLSTTLRMGVGNSNVDNFCNGGIVCRVSNEGILGEYAFDEKNHRYKGHPQAGEFSQFTIPSVAEAITMVCKLAERFPYFRCIAWDVAIDKNGTPTLIEANFYRGSLDVIQSVNGPMFGEYTDDVLREVFKH